MAVSVARNRFRTLGAILSLTLLPCLAFADEPAPDDSGPSNLGQALIQGEVHLKLRYRFETVSEDIRDKDAYASTLRTALAYSSNPFKGFQIQLEAEDVTAIGNELYRNVGAGDLDNGVRDRPVVADPEITEVNRAILRFQRGDTTLDLGRREINLDNHRFVGNVGWRQHHQSFDGVVLEQRSIPRTRLTYAYLDRVNRIFGDSRPMSSHLLNFAIDTGPTTDLVLYGYRVDYDELGLSSLSTDTFGARLVGKFEPTWGRCGFELELAEQSDTGDNPADVDAGYQLVKLFVGGGDWDFTVAREVLEGGADGRFTTPLATLHKFNGWADKFLNTPSIGLVDTFATLRFSRGPFAADATYHVFESDSGSVDYGEELDLRATWKSPWKQVFGVKAALYDADRLSFDTEKVWLWTSWGF